MCVLKAAVIVCTLCVCDCVLVVTYIHACVSMFDGGTVCVVCVWERCDIRLLCNGDVTAVVYIRCKCVCVFVCGAPSVGPS